MNNGVKWEQKKECFKVLEYYLVSALVGAGVAKGIWLAVFASRKS